jgi:hypothetical protein
MFLSYETILLAFTFLRIFGVISPLSEYLQTSRLDFAKAWQHVQATTESIEAYSRDFFAIDEKAKEFVRRVNVQLEEISLEQFHDHEDREAFESILVLDSLPQKRVRKKRRMPGELAHDETGNQTELDSFRTHVYNCILDRVINSLKTRFESHKTLYADIACLDPERFEGVVADGIPEGAMQSILQLLPNMNPADLREELMAFATNYPLLKKSLQSMFYSASDEELEDTTTKQCCGNCPSCALKVLSDYRLNDRAYDNLYMAYKVLLTLSITQVHCERCFSKLKIVKNRLRSSLTAEHLQSFVLLSVEKDLLARVSPDEVMDELAKTSDTFRRLLF